MKSLIATIIGILMMGGISAQQTEVSSLKVPSIGQHVFTRLEKPTFVKTYVGNNLGVGINSPFDIPIYSLPNDTIIGVDGSILYATLNIEYQQRVREWMAFSLRVGMNARVGTEVGTLLMQGFSSIDYVSLGWLVQFYQSERLYVSGYFRMDRVNGSYINIGGFVRDIVNGNPNPSISNSSVTTSTHSTLNFIYVFGDLFAVVTNSGVGFGDHIFEPKDVFLYSLHVAGDLNFYNRWKLPLGFYVGYERNNLPELLQEPEEVTNVFFYKLNYTGSSDFNFTLEVNNTFTPIPLAKDPVNFTNLIFSIRVYFQ